MAFDFLKKLFGCKQDATESSAVEQKECPGGCASAKKKDESSRDTHAEGKPARRRNSKSRREPASHREPREIPSNLSPEQQQEAVDKLNAFVLHVAKSLVNFPDQVSTALVNGENDLTTIMISCAKGDAGKLIGRNGKIISSIRVLVSCNAARNGLKVSVDIQD